MYVTCRVPEKVSWAQMAEALNVKWTSQCGTSKGLTEDNIYYLACKAFRNNQLNKDDFRNFFHRPLYKKLFMLIQIFQGNFKSIEPSYFIEAMDMYRQEFRFERKSLFTK